MLQWYTSVSKHKLSWVSLVCFLDSSVLCFYLSGEAPPICCYHGDSPSLVSCLQRSEQTFSVLNPVNVECINMRIHKVDVYTLISSVLSSRALPCCTLARKANQKLVLCIPVL